MKSMPYETGAALASVLAQKIFVRRNNLKTHLDREAVVVGRIPVTLALAATLPNQDAPQNAKPQWGHLAASRPMQLHDVVLPGALSQASTSVTQGPTSLLTKTREDSGCENLQRLLNERKIARAMEFLPTKDTHIINIPPLLPPSGLIDDGAIVSECNVLTGGAGARFLGISLSSEYWIDQVTANLHGVDIRGGEILIGVWTTKTSYSYEVRSSVFKFVNFKDLVEPKAGTTWGEPAKACGNEANEAAVVHLKVQGIQGRNSALKKEHDWYGPIIQAYLWDQINHYGTIATDALAVQNTVTEPGRVVSPTPAARPAPVSRRARP